MIIKIKHDQSQTIFDTGKELKILETEKKLTQSSDIIFELDQNSRLKYYFLYKNTKVSKSLTFNLNAEGASAELTGLFQSKSTQQINLNSKMVHNAPNTYGNTLVKGALTDSSKAILKGMIKINKGAHGSDDLLTERVLLLSPKARAEADPQLEIDADEVKATHAATISKINKDHLYYLQTRGLAEEEGKKFIVDGFFQEILDMFPENFKLPLSSDL